MAHEITTRADGFAEIAFVGETPWHGLGQELEHGASLDQWRKAAGLDWRIERSPVQYVNGDTHTFDGQDVLYRSDNNNPLSIVSSRYKEVQPEDVLHFFKDLTEASGFKLHTAGSLRGGRRIWALAETGKAADVVDGDTVAGYVLLATSCDKGMATSARFTSVRVVCANTLRAAESASGGHGVVSVPHSTIFNPQAVKQKMGIAVSAFDTFMADARHLANRQVTTAKVEEFMAKLIAPYAVPNSDLTKNRSYRKILDLFNGEGMGADMRGVRGTAWGLVNAVTEYTDHHNPSHTSDARLNSAWFGKGDAFKKEALELALSI